MRHNLGYRKLGRVTEHRIALLRNQAIALLRHEKIETTMPKAKELRPFVERLITIAKRGVAAGDANGKSLARAPAWCWPSCRTRKSSASCSTRLRRASPSGPAATRASCASASAAATRRRSRTSSSWAASTTRQPPPRPKARRKRRRRPRASANASGRPRSACATPKAEGGSKAQAGGQTRGKAQKIDDAEKSGRVVTKFEVNVKVQSKSEVKGPARAGPFVFAGSQRSALGRCTCNLL